MIGAAVHCALAMALVTAPIPDEGTEPGAVTDAVTDATPRAESSGDAGVPSPRSDAEPGEALLDPEDPAAEEAPALLSADERTDEGEDPADDPVDDPAAEQHDEFGDDADDEPWSDEFGDEADGEPWPDDEQDDGDDALAGLDDYDPSRDSPQGLRATRWIRTGIGAMSVGGALMVGALVMGSSDPCNLRWGNSCQRGARSRAALTMGIPAAALMLGGATALGFGLERRRELSVDVHASREQLGLTIRGRF